MGLESVCCEDWGDFKNLCPRRGKTWGVSTRFHIGNRPESTNVLEKIGHPTRESCLGLGKVLVGED